MAFKKHAITNIHNAERILQKYVMLKTGTYNFSPFDAEYRTLFNEILKSHINESSETILEDQLMRMVKKFVNELAVKLNVIAEKDKIKISADEVKRLMTVESYLVKDFSTAPPSIYSLSRVGAMSSTSLKNKFKKCMAAHCMNTFKKAG